MTAPITQDVLTIPRKLPESGRVNIVGLTRDQLLEAGLPDEGIFGLDLCTASMPDSFFSYRRDGICGRQANVIWIA